MIMFTVTKPRRKLKRFLQAAALVLLLAVVVPGIYHSLESVGAMSLFASGESVSGPAESINPETAPPENAQADEAAALPETEKAAENPSAEEQAADTPPAEESAAEIALEAEAPGLWQDFLTVIFGEKAQVAPY